jgi:hypothetical protein
MTTFIGDLPSEKSLVTSVVFVISRTEISTICENELEDHLKCEQLGMCASPRAIDVKIPDQTVCI